MGHVLDALCRLETLAEAGASPEGRKAQARENAR